MARKGLGKGLDALIPGGFQAESTESTLLIPIEKIAPNPSQPRSEIDDESLGEMVLSITEHGIIQPLILTRDEDSDNYTLIAGERRLRAARLAGLRSVPAVVRQASEQERLELALIENIQRENLNAIEEAHAYESLQEEFGLSQDQVAERVGKSRVAVTNTLRLLKLPSSIQDALQEGLLSEGHARALLGLSTSQAQLAVMESIKKNGLNVRQTEELVRNLSGRKPESPPPSKPPKSAAVKAIEDRLRSRLGTKVVLNHSGKSGTIIIHYYSEEELDHLINSLLE
jgi:ParB family chromosome partitioning protein